MKIKVNRIEEKDLPKLVEFNNRMYPERDRVEESISYRLLENPFAHKLSSYISYLEDGSIVGQLLLMPSQFRFNKDIQDATWGMDYIVDEKYRGSIAGVNLCKKAIKENSHFGIGLSEVSLKMHLIFDERLIGQMTKFIKIYDFLAFSKIVKKRINDNTKIFPKEIKLSGTSFYKVNTSEEIKSDNGYWNGDDILEFSRNFDFLKWRFFYYSEKFAVYKMKEDTQNVNSVYFVLRPLVWKNHNCFLLVDYRMNSTKDFNWILKAVNKLSRLNKVTATITGSTLDSLNKELKKKWYFPFGEKMDIVSNFKDIFPGNKIENENVMVTFADSDCDYYYGNDKW